jgi:hypothetical protein
MHAATEELLENRHDVLSKAWTDRRNVYSAKARIFNNMLYMRCAHLSKVKHVLRDKPTLSSEWMSHKDYDRKSSAWEQAAADVNVQRMRLV